MSNFLLNQVLIQKIFKFRGVHNGFYLSKKSQRDPFPCGRKTHAAIFYDEGRGTGLGLSISQGIIENHNGKIWLDRSSTNTRFLVELPIKQSVQVPKAA